jgi:hypothetical protein
VNLGGRHVCVRNKVTRNLSVAEPALRSLRCVGVLEE